MGESEHKSLSVLILLAQNEKMNPALHDPTFLEGIYSESLIF